MKALALALVLWAWPILQPSIQTDPVCYVFVPTADRPRAVQEKLNRDFPGMEFVVFGRIQEFRSRIIESEPDAILTLPLVLSSLPRYEVVAQGLQGELNYEGVMLLSVDQPIAVKASSVIGVVDLLGRRSMQENVAAALRLESVKVRTVAKLEDLLTLLQFQDVDAILVPNSSVAYYTNRSRLNLVAAPIGSSRYGLPQFAVHRNRPAVARQLTGLMEVGGTEITTLLGVESWAKP